jgi:hypothetical protein
MGFRPDLARAYGLDEGEPIALEQRLVAAEA